MSKYVIYRKSNSKIMINSRTNKEYYASMGRAELALKRMVNQNLLTENTEPGDDGLIPSNYACAEIAHYRKEIEQFHMVKNLLSGKEVRESVNTPNYCSVGSEAYFCM